MSRVLTRLAKTSPADIWKFLSDPGMIPVLMSAPPSSAPIDAVARLFPDAPSEQLAALRLQFLMDHDFFRAVDQNMVPRRHRRAVWRDWYEFLYMLVRILKPGVFVETGVFDGQSSSVILRAMEENGRGKLISIDLPATDAIAGSTHRMLETTLPPGCQPGWVVPEYLRGRYDLRFGDARVLLPEAFKSFPEVDVFFHDSLHTYDHMYFEYTCAWPHVARGGLVISDDIFWSKAFHQFCRENNRPYVRVGGFGGMRK
ncbi:MAG: class I SAM-dependent methyltransferase [Phycisphaerales bacterium]|nr:class I SAM-dependent methyltransferase [Phycisphaerales bacterium]